MAQQKPLDPEQLSIVRDFLLDLGEKFKTRTEHFEELKKCSMPEITVLRILSREGPLVVKEIASRLNNISMSNLTRILDRLENNQYIERNLNREDRRSFRISLLPMGQQLAEEYQYSIELMAEAMLDALTPTERLILVELYGKVRANLDDQDAKLAAGLEPAEKADR